MIGPQHLIFGTDSMPQQLPTLDRRSMLAMRHFLHCHIHRRREVWHVIKGEGNKLCTAELGK